MTENLSTIILVHLNYRNLTSVSEAVIVVSHEPADFFSMVYLCIWQLSSLVQI